MAGSFPTSVTTYTNPGPTTATATAVGTRTHDQFHADNNDDLEQVMTKLGTGSSVAAANTVLRGTGSGTTAFGQVVDADVASAAAVAVSKLAAGGTANRVVATVDGTTMAMQQIVASMIANDTITATQLAADSVGASELADNSVASANIIDGSIVNADINAAAGITGGKIAAQTITGASVGAGMNIAYQTIYGGQAGANSNIAPGSILAGDMQAGGAANRVVATTDGTTMTMNVVNTLMTAVNAITQVQSAFVVTVTSTTSGTYVDIAGMTLSSMTTTGGPVLFFLTAELIHSSVGSATLFQIYDNGSATPLVVEVNPAGTGRTAVTLIGTTTPSAVAHVFKVMWFTNTGTANLYMRSFVAVELKR